MEYKVIMEPPVPVYVAPVSEASRKWGVYGLPVMWKNPGGDYILRVNGEMDSYAREQAKVAPYLYFQSMDEGRSWREIRTTDEETGFDTFLNYITPPYIHLKDGSVIGLRMKAGLPPVGGAPRCLKSMMSPNKACMYHTFYYREIPDECKAMEIITFEKDGSVPVTEPMLLDMPLKAVDIVTKAEYNGEWTDVPMEFSKSAVLDGVAELGDGTLLAAAVSQNLGMPGYYLDLTCIASSDRGKTWKARGVIENKGTFTFGSTNECSMLEADNGDILCAVRTDFCRVDPCDTVYTALCISEDKGYTWSAPQNIADSSVTPHLIGLEQGIIALIYGRPGVHMKVSADNGRTWGYAHSIIGRSLVEELRAGAGYADCKYGNTISYSNTCVFRVGGGSFLVSYTDFGKKDSDNNIYKATVVRRITVTGASFADEEKSPVLRKAET